MKHRAFYGDGEYTFALTDDMIAELERVSGLGIGALYLRTAKAQFPLTDLVEIIRLGLIGGGTSPEAAMRLVNAYGRNRPIGELFPLAMDILDARWSGTANPEPQA
ncbi:hypothetical protein ATO6_12250 [Oceanicola sp. 22II-s10i]|uniref:gene transfer agent family protein n=1 Tax=Oceanicola sp. 22II-s10i TaxID=1317116 RepID=UPI000B5214CA|nr:gene transfer agent family protein [Oceanicola sp. 22II-s10i]OWU84460.1 hypothetical protein ATO6_12250 [Oceanicola sp. 22II-s10i]